MVFDNSSQSRIKYGRLFATFQTAQGSDAHMLIKVPECFVPSGEARLVIRKSGFGHDLHVDVGSGEYRLFHGRLLVHERKGMPRLIEPQASMGPIYEALVLADRTLNSYQN